MGNIGNPTQKRTLDAICTVLKRTYTRLTGGEHNKHVLCAYSRAHLHVGCGYDQDMWRILMQITIFLPKIVQKQASDPCYSLNIDSISGLR